MQKNKKTTTSKKRNYTKRAMRLRREAFLSLLLIFCTMFLLIKFHSSPERYKLVIYNESNEEEVIQYYTDFKAAKQEMQKQIDLGKFNPALLNADDQIVAIRYGVINF